MLIPILQIRKLRHKTLKQLVLLSGPSQDSNHVGQFQSSHRTSALYIYLGVGVEGGKAGREEEGKKPKQSKRSSPPPTQNTHT